MKLFSPSVTFFFNLLLSWSAQSQFLLGRFNTFECPFPGLFPVPNDCALYQRCLFARMPPVVTLRCPDGHVFEPISTKCVPAEDGSCRSAQTQNVEIIQSETRKDKPRECDRDGYKPDPTSKEWYINCSNGIPTRIKCYPDGFTFNPETVQCLSPARERFFVAPSQSNGAWNRQEDSTTSPDAKITSSTFPNGQNGEYDRNGNPKSFASSSSSSSFMSSSSSNSFSSDASQAEGIQEWKDTSEQKTSGQKVLASAFGDVGEESQDKELQSQSPPDTGEYYRNNDEQPMDPSKHEDYYRLPANSEGSAPAKHSSNSKAVHKNKTHQKDPDDGSTTENYYRRKEQISNEMKKTFRSHRLDEEVGENDRQDGDDATENYYRTPGASDGGDATENYYRRPGTSDEGDATENYYRKPGSGDGGDATENYFRKPGSSDGGDDTGNYYRKPASSDGGDATENYYRKPGSGDGGGGTENYYRKPESSDGGDGTENYYRKPGSSDGGDGTENYYRKPGSSDGGDGTENNYRKPGSSDGGDGTGNYYREPGSSDGGDATENYYRKPGASEGGDATENYYRKPGASDTRVEARGGEDRLAKEPADAYRENKDEESSRQATKSESKGGIHLVEHAEDSKSSRVKAESRMDHERTQEMTAASTMNTTDEAIVTNTRRDKSNSGSNAKEKAEVNKKPKVYESSDTTEASIKVSSGPVTESNSESEPGSGKGAEAVSIASGRNSSADASARGEESVAMSSTNGTGSQASSVAEGSQAVANSTAEGAGSSALSFAQGVKSQAIAMSEGLNTTASASSVGDESEANSKTVGDNSEALALSTGDDGKASASSSGKVASSKSYAEGQRVTATSSSDGDKAKSYAETRGDNSKASATAVSHK